MFTFCFGAVSQANSHNIMHFVEEKSSQYFCNISRNPGLRKWCSGPAAENNLQCQGCEKVSDILPPISYLHRQ